MGNQHRVEDFAPDAIEDNNVGLRDQPYIGLFPTDQTTRHTRPDSVLQALMEQAPGDPLDESLEEAQPVIDAIRQAQQRLNAEDQYMLDAINIEGITFRELGKRLGVSHQFAHRHHRRSLERLSNQLLKDPHIRKRLRMTPTWNSAALEELSTIAGDYDGWPDNCLLDITDAIATITTNIEAAVSASNDGREGVAVRQLGDAAEEAVLYLRSVGKWNLLDMHDLLCSKQADYGHGNINKFGMVGVLVRATDKAERLKNLSTGTRVAPRNESLLDTFYDVIGYAVIARMLKAETFNYELDSE